MRASLILSSALFSSSFAELLQPSPSTSDATITAAPDVPMELLRKQNNDRFMGWVSFQGTWTSRQCDLGGTYYASGSYWRCCATTVAGCDVPVGCVAGSLVYSLTGSGTASLTTIGCTTIFSDPTDSSFTVCNTGFLFENSADSTPQTNIYCGVSSLNWSYYRVRPEETTPTPESTPRSTPRSTPITTTTSPGGPGQTSPPDEEGDKKEASKAWIAGAVVGPIVGLALIGVGLFFCLRRKKAKTQPAASGAQGQFPPQQSYPNSPQPPPGYYPPQMQQNPQAGMVPFGVAKHESWAPQSQSPQTQASTSPHPPQSPMYGPPPGAQQQWQPQPQQQAYSGQPGLVPSHQQGYQQNSPPQVFPQASPPLSPQPQAQFKHEMPTANELDGSHTR